jgi:hypothetical protein
VIFITFLCAEFEKLINDLNIDYLDLDSEKFNSKLFTYKVIYDNPHNSDEQSYRYILFFEGDACCIYGYTGDRGDFYSKYFSKKRYLKLYNYFTSLLDFTIDIIENEEELSDSYTNSFILNEILYSNLTNLDWSFVDLSKKDIYRLNDDDSITSMKFIKFKVKKETLKDDEKIIIANIDGKIEEVEFYKILIKESL